MELEEASAVARRLIDLGYADAERWPVSVARDVMSCYWLPIIWAGDNSAALEGTRRWREAGPLKGTLGVLHAQALRNAADHSYDTMCFDGGMGDVERGLCRAAEVLDELLGTEGYLGILVAEGMKLVEQLVYASRSRTPLSPMAARHFVRFADRHLALMCQAHRGLSLESPTVWRWIHTLSELDVGGGHQNAFLGDRWQGRDRRSRAPQASAVDGWVAAKVYYRPLRAEDGRHRAYLFACDDNEKQYFVPRSVFEDEDKEAWDQIRVGDRLEVVPDPAGEEGGREATPVRGARRT